MNALHDVSTCDAPGMDEVAIAPVAPPKELGLRLKPTRAMPRELVLEARTYRKESAKSFTAVSAMVVIGPRKALGVAAYINEYLQDLRIVPPGKPGAGIWIGGTAFDLTAAEFPRVEAWVTDVRAMAAEAS